MTQAGIQLLIIDPQNDFMDTAGASLPVQGATADMRRLAAFIDAAGPAIDEIVVTLDSHHSVGIERPAIWMRGDGCDVKPFTQIGAADVRSGTFRPRDAAHLPRVLSYLDALEAGGRYKLMVWPVHCEIGTWGHNVESTVREAYNRWEARTLRPVRKVFKGMNAWTENYSALRAEVPDPLDEGTALNTSLIGELGRGGRIVIAGEASSHCVRATTEHLVDNMDPAHAAKIVLLSDCMNPVAGFEAQAQEFLASMRNRGASVMRSDELAAALVR